MMRMSFTLSRYIGWQFFLSILVALAVVLGVAGLIDLVELIRRTSEKGHVPFTVILEMTFLKLPYIAEQVMPFAVLIGGMMALTRLTRSQELVVARASGISVWQFMMPAVLLSLVIGVFMITVFNPLSAAMISRFEQLEGRYISGRSSLFMVSSSGLWLRQVDADGTTLLGKEIKEYILHADRISQNDYSMTHVTIYTFDDAGAFVGRMDAEKAKLEIGYWDLKNTAIARPGMLAQQHDSYKLPTSLRITEIQDSFAEPRTLSFWELSGFIRTLEKAGFSALRHRIYWHAILSGPLLLVGMTMLAAVFSLRLPRRGRISLLILGGLVAGFSLHFLMSLFQAFGYSGSLPILLAAWAPPTIVLMAAVAILLHLEDG